MAKIYTRLGDQGITSILGGERLPKSHPRFHAYGTIDELNAHIGLLNSLIDPAKEGQMSHSLLKIQHNLFIAGGILACDNEHWLAKLPKLDAAATTELETSIDNWTQQLPELKNFILPGGTPSALQSHLARTVCRRAERWTLEVSQSTKPELLADYQIILKYLNRLSDYLFTLSRWLNWQAKREEIPWTPA